LHQKTRVDALIFVNDATFLACDLAAA